MFLKYEDRIVNLDTVDVIECSMCDIDLHQGEHLYSIKFKTIEERETAYKGIVEFLFMGHPLYVIQKEKNND